MQNERTIPDRRERTSGRGRAHGGFEWPYGRLANPGRLPFDTEVVPGGYLWWYLDAISDDGAYALTVIAFVGSVFSPAYFKARSKVDQGLVDPMQFCAINVALHGPGGGETWVFNEYDARMVTRSANTLSLGHTQLERHDGGLRIDIDERTKPFFQSMSRKVVGCIDFSPAATFDRIVKLDAKGHHRWLGLAPRGRVRVTLSEPEISFEGSAYHDANHGLEPLEKAFSSWTWSRTELSEGTAVLYDTHEVEGHRSSRGMLFRSDGEVRPFEAPKQVALPRGKWGVSRSSRLDQDGTAKVRKTLIDSPFYLRSLVDTELGGERAVAVHEALDMNRFSSGWVRFLLPWRIRGISK